MKMNRNRPRNRVGYRIENADGAEASLYLYGEIGFWGKTAQQFAAELNAIAAETINVHINSGGGEVFDAMAMYAALNQHPARIVTHIDGIAASAATYPALAGDEIRMIESGFFMIHDPMSIVIGNSDAMRKEADVLDKIRDSIAGIYSNQTGAKLAQVRKWMSAETWFNADEAKREGFVDKIVDGDAKSDVFDLSIYNNVPDALRRRGVDDDTDAPLTGRDVERIARDVLNLSQRESKRLAAAFKQLGSPRDEGEQVDDIAAVCAAVNSAITNSKTR